LKNKTDKKKKNARQRRLNNKDWPKKLLRLKNKELRRKKELPKKNLLPKKLIELLQNRPNNNAWRKKLTKLRDSALPRKRLKTSV
jgi:hypothetical protein